MFPRRWMLPSLNRSDLFREMDLFREKDSEVIRVKEDQDKLEVSLDTSQYRPDELRVSVSGREVCIEGRHEEKNEDGSRMVARQFVRRSVVTHLSIKPCNTKCHD
jgi:HSP20 family molecular chaperone IbpA